MIREIITSLILVFTAPHIMVSAQEANSKNYQSHQKLDADKSSVWFEAIQNDSKIRGDFKNFNIDIFFDKNKLESSFINVTIKMDSIDTSYDEIKSELIKPEWFNIDSYNTATFTSNSFSHLKDNLYQADGTITIKNVSKPLTIEFTLDEDTSASSVASGSVTILRRDYNVGTGEWQDTKSVKDEVLVNFNIVISKSI